MVWGAAISGLASLGSSLIGSSAQSSAQQNAINQANKRADQEWLQANAASLRAYRDNKLAAEEAALARQADALNQQADAIYQVAFQNEIIDYTNAVTTENYGIALDLYGQRVDNSNAAALAAYAENQNKLDETMLAANYMMARHNRNLETALQDAAFTLEGNLQDLEKAVSDEGFAQAKLSEELFSTLQQAEVEVDKGDLTIEDIAAKASQSVALAQQQLEEFTTEQNFALTEGRLKTAAARGTLQAGDDGNRGRSYDLFIDKSTAAQTGMAEARMSAKAEQEQNKMMLTMNSAMRNASQQQRLIKMGQFGTMSSAQNSARMTDILSSEQGQELQFKRKGFALETDQLSAAVTETQKRFNIAASEVTDSILSANKAKTVRDDQIYTQARNQRLNDYSQVAIPPTLQLNIPAPRFGALPTMPTVPAWTPTQRAPSLSAPSGNSMLSIGNSILGGISTFAAAGGMTGLFGGGGSDFDMSKVFR